MIDKYIIYIEKVILDYLETIRKSCNNKLFSAIDYMLSSGGKRVRPVLMLISAEINGVSIEDIKELALALELIHTYSLIHDDLPAMDNDDIRRGRPSCHIAFGEDMAILAGDALLNCAMELLITAASKNASFCEAALYLARNAGINGMIGGQAIDIRLNSSNSNKENIMQMSRLKTGRMIESALVCPCLVSGNSHNYEDFLSLGKNIGLAFQISDDILDSSQEKDNKITLIDALGYEGCCSMLNKLENESIAILEKYKEKAVILTEFIHNLTRRTT